jgi:hypothetical protein
MQKKPTQPPKPPQKSSGQAGPPPGHSPGSPPGRPTTPPSRASTPPPGRPTMPPPTRATTPPPRQPVRPATQPAGVQARRPGTPPRQMITAEEREQLKAQRRAAFSGAPAAPARPAAGAGAAAASLDEALRLEVDRFNAIQGKLMLTQVNDDLEDIDGAINALPVNIDNVRARGYMFKSYLERKAERLAQQWSDLKPQVQASLASQASALRVEAAGVQNALNRRQLATAALSTLETKVGAAIRNLQGMYDTLDSNVNQTQRQIDDISWTLQQIEQASFSLMATEAPVEAVPASFKRDGAKDSLNGVLYLTDRRLIFEQKEEVAAKKVLFITTSKEKVQELVWEVPAGQIAKAVGSKRGFMNKDDYLTVTVAEGAHFRGPDGQPLRAADAYARPMTSIDIHLKGETGEAWQGFIGRVKSGEIDKERTVPVDQAVIEAVSNAPTKCPNCGATITQTIMRGQTELTCEFCGSVIRL